MRSTVLVVSDDDARATGVLSVLTDASVEAARIGWSEIGTPGLEEARVAVALVPPGDPPVERLRRIRRCTGAGVVLVGEEPEAREAVQALSEGARAYLFWPVAGAALLAAVRDASGECGETSNCRTCLDILESRRRASEQAATLIEGKKRLQRRNRHLNLLHEASMALSETLDAESLLAAFHAILRKVVRVDWSLVALEMGERPLRVLAVHGPGILWRSLAEIVVCEGSALLALPVRPEELVCENLAEHVDLALADLRPARRNGPDRHLAYRLGVEADRAGLLAFGWRGPELNGELERLASTLARQAALAFANARRFDLARDLSRRDPLTGLYNRGALLDAISRELERGRRYPQPLSLLFLDLDHFKRINDRYGHLTGDQVLREISRAITAAARRADLPARYGGEEFAVLMPQTETGAGRALAERIRKEVRSVPWDFEGSVTASVGVAGFPAGVPGTADELIARADAALYRAKRSGRDRTVVDVPLPPAPRLPVIRPARLG